MKGKKLLAFMLAVVMGLSIIACGKETDEVQEDGGEYVYVPSFEDLESEENGWLSGVTIQDGVIYYLTSSYDEEAGASYTQICKKEMTEGAEVEILYSMDDSEQDEGEYKNLHNFVLLPDGKMCFLYSVWSQATEMNSWFMQIVDAQGNEIFMGDITQAVNEGTEYAYVQRSIADADGNIYLQGEDRILVYDVNGNFLFRVEAKGSWIQDIGKAKDGTVLVLQNAGGNTDLSSIDVAKKNYGTSYPGADGYSLMPGISKDVLLRTNDGLSEYDFKTQTSEEILTWLDCDINPDYVEAVSSTPDGKLIVLLRDWSSGSEYQLCTLTKTLKSEVPQKEIITIATMGLSQGVQNEIVNFNKTNSQYRLRVIDYSKDVDWEVENSYEDAIARFNSDIMTGNAADIIDLSVGDYAMYMNKGIIEDLWPYLENSTKVDKNDLNASVLEAYDMDGKLPCIPANFMINTIVARGSDLGDRTGWTMKDLIAYADSKPADSMIFRYGTKTSILLECMMMDEGSYIDWSTGECHFDSDAFKALLEFASRFPDEYEYDETMSEPKLIGEGKLLLQPYSISEFNDIQWLSALWQGDYTFIGYPTADGSNGTVIYGYDTFGINVKSEKKEGAWQFLESLLTEKYQTGMFSYGMPSLNSAFDKKLEEKMQKNWQLDENGEQVLDEDGNPIEISNGGMSYDDFSVDFYAVTEEEAAQLKALIDGASEVGNYTGASEIFSIVEEEAAPYFAGQKSLDEVVGIIQSRVSIYISENM